MRWACCGVVLVGSGCSLLFEATEPPAMDAMTFDAPPGEDASTAGNVVGCTIGPELPGTVVVFPMDQTAPLTGVWEGNGGGGELISSAYDPGLMEFQGVAPASAGGSPECGSGISLEDENRVLRLYASSFAGLALPASIDFWFRFTSIPSDRGGLVTKDTSGAAVDHLGVYVYNYEEGMESFSRIVARIQGSPSPAALDAGTNTGTYGLYLCSEPVADNQWHHIALSFSPGMEPRLFVDGQQSIPASAQFVLASPFPETPCGESFGDFARNAAPSDSDPFNSDPGWMFGGDNSASSDGMNLFRLHQPMVIDQIRVTSGVFDAATALEVYQAAFPPAGNN